MTSSVWRRVGARILFAFSVFLAVSLLAYLFAVSSGNHFWNVAAQLASEHYKLTPAQFLQLQEYYHLNQPVAEGYLLWLAGLFSGNLGISISGQPVAAVVERWILPTLELQVPALLVGLTLGLVIGLFSARRHGSKTDTIASISMIVVVTLPAFWLSSLAIVVFSLKLHLLPSFGVASAYPPYWWGSPSLDAFAHWIMPFAVLTAVTTPLYARVARASAVEALTSDSVMALRASGVRERTILLKHVLRNSLGPVLAIAAISFGLSVGASPGIELAFSWPGLGKGLVTSALGYDQPVEMAIVLLMTLITLTASILADLAYSFVDPRLSPR